MLLQIIQRVGNQAGMDKDYAEILITAMRRQGVTQQQLAEAVGLDHTTMCRKLQPGKRWWVDQYDKALKFLRIDPSEAFGEGRRIGALNQEGQENGGAMAEVYDMVKRLDAYRKDPAGTRKKLNMVVELEKGSPQAFNKLVHDIQYHYDEMRASKKARAAPKKENVS